MSSNIFLQQMEQPRAEAGEASDNIFLNQMQDMSPKPEGLGKSMARTLYQPVGGVAKRWTWPLDIWKGLSETVSKENIRDLAEGEPRLQGENREKIFREIEKAHEKFPTQARGEELLEEKFGLPLRPKSELQKNIRFGTELATFRPGSLVTKAQAGGIGLGAKHGLEALGVPEEISEPVAAVASGVTPTGKFSAATKPSGMKSRFFEKMKTPTKVSPERHLKITEKVEGDVRKITDKLLSEHPSFKEMRDNPHYRQELSEGMQKVSELAEGVEGRITPKHLESFMNRRLRTWGRETKGLTLSESEKAFADEFQKHIGDVKDIRTPFTVKDMVDQYRKNSKSLGEYFDPSKPKSLNTGKRDALLEYNRGIQELFETMLPESEFTKFFKAENKHWSDMAAFESVEATMDKMFPGQTINFKEAQKILDPKNANLRRNFQQLMGKEGFKNFEGLMKDLMGVKNPYGLLKKAEAGGFKNLAKLAGSYLLHPNLAKTKLMWDIGKDSLKMLLDKPQLAVEWKSALDAFKKGRFQDAQDRFEKLDGQIQKYQTIEESPGARAGAEKAESKILRKNVMPEEAATSRPESFTEKAHTLGAERKIYDFYPSEEAIKTWKLKDKPEPLTKRDHDLLSGMDVPPLTNDEKVLFKNQWNQLLDPKLREVYYKPFIGEKSVGTLGDWIIDPNLRKIYRKVLDTPVILDSTLKGATTGPIVNASKKQAFLDLLDKEGIRVTSALWAHPKARILARKSGYYEPGQQIKLGLDFSPSQVFSNIVHEGHHAFQDMIKVEESVAKLGREKAYGKTTFMGEDATYFERRREVGARLAQRYASKRLVRARNAAMKTAKAEKLIDTSSQVKRSSP